MSFIRLDNVIKTFNNVQALRGLSLHLDFKSQNVVRGPSGSGKSTFLYLLGGLDRPTQGKVWVNGENLFGYDDQKLSSYRNSFVGFIFQFHFLLPTMNCINNILLPSRIGNRKSKKRMDDINKLSDYLGVTHCLKKYPYELSGGEQQRINIIRALSMRPKLLLCDEPTGNLDSDNSEKVVTLLQELSSEFEATLVIVTHDSNVAAHFSNEFVIQDGKLV